MRSLERRERKGVDFAQSNSGSPALPWALSLQAPLTSKGGGGRMEKGVGEAGWGERQSFLAAAKHKKGG